MFTLEQMKVQQPHKISLFTITKSSLVIYKGNMFATESKEDLKNWLFDIWVQLFVIWSALVVTNEIKIKPSPSAFVRASPDLNLPQRSLMSMKVFPSNILEGQHTA